MTDHWPESPGVQWEFKQFESNEWPEINEIVKKEKAPRDHNIEEIPIRSYSPEITRIAPKKVELLDSRLSMYFEKQPLGKLFRRSGLGRLPQDGLLSPERERPNSRGHGRPNSREQTR